jgi:hypothetical protein
MAAINFLQSTTTASLRPRSKATAAINSQAERWSYQRKPPEGRAAATSWRGELLVSSSHAPPGATTSHLSTTETPGAPLGMATLPFWKHSSTNPTRSVDLPPPLLVVKALQQPWNVTFRPSTPGGAGGWRGTARALSRLAEPAGRGGGSRGEEVGYTISREGLRPACAYPTRRTLC